MLNGKQSPNCQRCYREEKVDFISKRIASNKKWAKNYGPEFKDIISKVSDDGSMPFEMKYFDFRPGTKCNLKCVICDPDNSHLWVKENQTLQPKMKSPLLKDYYEYFIKNSKSEHNWHQRPIIQEEVYGQLKNLETLYFAGGEPLIIQEHYKILEECIRKGYAKNMKLRYNSNATRWREDLFEKWEHFKTIEMSCSIDDIQERNEYIRYPSQWEKLEKTLCVLDEQAPKNVSLSITCAVQAMNIYYLPEFLNWFFQKNSKDFKSHFFIWFASLHNSTPEFCPKTLR